MKSHSNFNLTCFASSIKLKGNTAILIGFFSVVFYPTKAQFIVGGNLSLQVEKQSYYPASQYTTDIISTNLQIMPRIGRAINDSLTIGIGISYGMERNKVLYSRMV
ncbi:MAG: hypothetical protein HC896_15305, partial [Bacteroidales bacterium]|nr:hypothetical protein [Bacteroidales bacterium]